MSGVMRHTTTALLTTVGGLSTFALAWSFSKPEFTHHEIVKISTALALLSLTAMYAFLHRRFPLHWSGIPTFLASCAAVIWLLPDWIYGVYKNFAPASQEEASQAFWEGAVALTGVAVVAVVAWLVVASLSSSTKRRQVEQVSCPDKRQVYAVNYSLLKYSAAVLPFVLPFATWQVAKVIGRTMGCTVPSMPPMVCMHEYADLQLLLGPVAWWSERLWPLGLAVSVAWVGYLHLRTRR